MTVGNLAALRQRHAVRLLAWSSVAQAGYLLVPLAAGGVAATSARCRSYALMYAVVNLAAFARGRRCVELGGASPSTTSPGWRGAHPLARGRPRLRAALPGRPAARGRRADGQGGGLPERRRRRARAWLAVVMAVNVAIGLVYYLRWIAITFRPVGTAEPAEPRRTPASLPVVVGATLVAAVVLSVVPAPFFSVLP